MQQSKNDTSAVYEGLIGNIQWLIDQTRGLDFESEESWDKIIRLIRKISNKYSTTIYAESVDQLLLQLTTVYELRGKEGKNGNC